MTQLPFSQAAENNKLPILVILREVLADTKTVLEIGSGTGQHAVSFAKAMPHLQWQPSEQSKNIDVLSVRFDAQAPLNVNRPIILDVADDPWKVEPVEAVYAANCVHIMSWGHVEKMFQGLGRALRPGGHLVLYGPFKYDGAFTSSSNATFEQWLKGNDPKSGIRDFEQLDRLANKIGLKLLDDYQMPANNQCLVWRRDSRGSSI